MNTGTVLWYDALRGYGFLQDHALHGNVFITRTSLQKFGLSGLERGTKLRYDVIVGKKSRKVKSIKGVEHLSALH